MPALHWPVVATSVPSTSILASAKNSVGCCGPDFLPHLVKHVQQRAHVACVEAAAEVAGRRRVGNAARPRASRNTSSLRRSSMSSKQVPSHSALYARFNTWSLS